MWPYVKQLKMVIFYLFVLKKVILYKVTFDITFIVLFLGVNSMFASGIFLYTSCNFIQQKSQKVSLVLSFPPLMLIFVKQVN